MFEEFLILAGFLASTVIGGLFFLKYYFECRKSEEGLKDLKIEREIPFEDRPYVVDYLFHSQITCRGMTATFIDLLRRKHISIKNIQNSKGFIGKALNLKDFLFTRLESKDHLAKPEKYLLDLIFAKQIGNSLVPNSVNQITLSEIAGYRSKASFSLFLLWKPFTEKEVVTNKTEKNFLDFSRVDKFSKIVSALFILHFVVFFAAWAFFGPNPIFLSGFFLTVIPILIFFGISFFPVILCKKTKLGFEHYIKWLGLKKFFDDFGYLKDKAPEEIVLWEKFLVFGTLFGNAKRINSSFEPVFTILESSYTGGTG
ncbi:MAG: DUF2207 domain-containing protein [Candidatus Diapherotrites archaeon]|nr:DUF2207 domain-containing protein [Candidatus Diapherotrites archaeon]